MSGLGTDELLGGAALLALNLAAALVFAAVLVRRRLAGLSGAPRAVAFGLLATVAFVAIHLVPGALGILGRGSVAACALFLLAAVPFVRKTPAVLATKAPFPSAPASGWFSWTLAALGLAVFAAYALAFAADRGSVLVETTDMPTFHLPNLARWIQSGTFWQVDEFVPHRAFGTYPHTSNVVLLGLVMPFRSEFLVPLANYPTLTLTVVATYALARELTAPAPSALLFATGFVAMPVVSFIAFAGLADTLMLGSFAAGLLFLARHRRTGTRSDLVLAGIGLGLSFGTKWYALPVVAITVAGWALLCLVDGRPWRRAAASLAGIVALVAATGGFWLLRNLVETGNPLFPVEVRAGGLTLFDAPRDIHRELVGHTLAGYLDRPRVWREVFWPNFLQHMSWFAVLLWTMLPLAAVLASRRHRAVGPALAVYRPVLAWFGVAAAIAVAYLFIPYTALGGPEDPRLAPANARYVVPALLIAAALGAWAAGRLGHLRSVLEVLALVALVDALLRNLDVSAGALLEGALAVAAFGALAWGVRGLARAGRGPLRAAAAAAAACALGLGLLGLSIQERRFDWTRNEEAAEPARWIAKRAPEGRRIGVVGEGFVVRTMFGPRFENEVEYVGPLHEDMLRTYRSRRELAAALDRGRYDLVLVQDAALVEPDLPARHERWLRGLGYRLVASGHEPAALGQPVRLYAAPRRLRSPAASGRGVKPSSASASGEAAGLGALRRASWSG